jgi:methylenetetrahydrofolate dehydrogenase (NADP+)/methenyltetrahydrofolate cyclohydrolase
VAVSDKEALVLGYGKLVGVPASLLLRHNGAHVTVVDQVISNLAEHTRESDIIICGVGKPGLLKPEMLKPGVVVIDAGTSEAGGKIVGDADPSCALVASVFTPVPGGVGPIAVALIFKNLLVLASARAKAQRG